MYVVVERSAVSGCNTSGIQARKVAWNFRTRAAALAWVARQSSERWLTVQLSSAALPRVS